MTNPVGYGIFAWNGYERRSNRYGSFVLSHDDYKNTVSEKPYFHDMTHLIGKKVVITAKVIDNRKSGHIGDLSLGIFPSMPEKNEIIELGVGYLDICPCEWNEYSPEILMKPDDNRSHFWFDPEILYRIHDQTVEIYIEETDKDFSPTYEVECEMEQATVVEKQENKEIIQLKTTRSEISIPPKIVKIDDDLFQITGYNVGDNIKI